MENKYSTQKNDAIELINKFIENTNKRFNQIEEWMANSSAIEDSFKLSLNEVRELVYKVNSDLQLLGISKMQILEKLFNIVEFMNVMRIDSLDYDKKLDDMFIQQNNKTSKIEDKLKRVLIECKKVLNLEKNVSENLCGELKAANDEGYISDLNLYENKDVMKGNETNQYQLDETGSLYNLDTNSENKPSMYKKRSSIFGNSLKAKFNEIKGKASFNRPETPILKSYQLNEAEMLDIKCKNKTPMKKRKNQDKYDKNSMPTLKGFLRVAGSNRGKINSQLFEKPSFDSISSGFSTDSKIHDLGKIIPESLKNFNSNDGLEIRISRNSIIKFFDEEELLANGLLTGSENINNFHSSYNAVVVSDNESDIFDLGYNEFEEKVSRKFDGSGHTEGYLINKEIADIELFEKNQTRQSYKNLNTLDIYNSSKSSESNMTNGKSQNFSDTDLANHNGIDDLVKIQDDEKTKLESEDLLVEILEELIENEDPYQSLKVNIFSDDDLFPGYIFGTIMGKQLEHG
ncbi:hypothetical protein AYI69_g9531 [Smittium culicis]|uniref:Uncharacterized protein n=1 Tax=Smittium culicis TaxID=133412 RepID=A0A1R1XBZ8_9FUNG|nr:hypothetical protein AYI69_g9531 [Smittium culicis]